MKEYLFTLCLVVPFLVFGKVDAYARLHEDQILQLAQVVQQEPIREGEPQDLYWEDPSFGFTLWQHYPKETLPANLISLINRQNFVRASFVIRKELYDRFKRKNLEAWRMYPRLLLNAGDYEAAIRAAFETLSLIDNHIDSLGVLILSFLDGRRHVQTAESYLMKIKMQCPDCVITKSLQKRIAEFKQNEAKKALDDTRVN